MQEAFDKIRIEKNGFPCRLPGRQQESWRAKKTAVRHMAVRRLFPVGRAGGAQRIKRKPLQLNFKERGTKMYRIVQKKNLNPTVTIMYI